jgi:hypothetical protein
VACSISFGISVTLTIGGLCYFLLIPAADLIGVATTRRAEVGRSIVGAEVNQA